MSSKLKGRWLRPLPLKTPLLVTSLVRQPVTFLREAIRTWVLVGVLHLAAVTNLTAHEFTPQRFAALGA